MDYGSPITRHKITQAEQIKGDQMGEVCSTHGRRAYEVLVGRFHLADSRVDDRIILKCVISGFRRGVNEIDALL